MRPPRILDLYCGGGGAGMGYSRAGFEVVGVDLQPQPRYPFESIQWDAIEVLERGEFSYFDAIHASPPCQAFSKAGVLRPDYEYSDLLTPTRQLLERIGKPWVIENVPGAPMRRDLILCGTMFGLEAEGFEVRRHRWFEFWDASSAPMAAPCYHRLPPVYGYGHSQDKNHRLAYGRCGAQTCRDALGVEWMNREELSQSIPPAFTQYIGEALRAAIGR